MSIPTLGTPKSRALDRIQQIRTALLDRNYRCIAEHPISPPSLGENITFWTDGWNTVILHIYRQGMGFELYVQATTKNDIQAVIDAIPVGNQDAAVRGVNRIDHTVIVERHGHCFPDGACIHCGCAPDSKAATGSCEVRS